MYGIDYDAKAKAEKGLVVSFIVSIVLVNVYLIIKTIRKGGVLNNVRSLTLISLAVGDIFLALFSLVVQAKVYYNNYEDLTCSSIKHAYIYMTFLLHFVFSLGLIIIAIDLVRRYKRQLSVAYSSSNRVSTITCSAVPWLLGLLIVLPVTMIDTGSAYNRIEVSCIYANTLRFTVMFAVGVVVPVSFALIVCVAVGYSVSVPQQYSRQVIHYQSTAQGPVIATYTNNMPQQIYTNGTAGTQQMLAPPSSTYHNYDYNENSKLIDAQNGSSSHHYPPPQYPSQYLQQQQQYHTNLAVSSSLYAIEHQLGELSVSALQNFKTEKNKLLSISVLLCTCVLPFAINSILDLNSKSTIITDHDITVTTVFFWISLFRSIITPLVWVTAPHIN